MGSINWDLKAADAIELTLGCLVLEIGMFGLYLRRQRETDLVVVVLGPW